jgi:hypothetical protein
MTTSINIAEIAEELRNLYDNLKIIKDDYLCISEYCNSFSSSNQSTNIQVPNNLDRAPKTKEFLTRIIDKYNRMINDLHSSTNALYARFKQEIIELMKKDDVMKECSQLEAPILSFNLISITDMDGLRSAILTYYCAKIISDSKGDIIKKISACFFKCMTQLIDNIPIIAEQFDEDTIAVKDIAMKLSTIFSKLNSELRVKLTNDFKNLTKQIVSCFWMYRFPVAIIPSKSPLFFGRFLGFVPLKDPYINYFQLQINQLCIYA